MRSFDEKVQSAVFTGDTSILVSIITLSDSQRIEKNQDNISSMEPMSEFVEVYRSGSIIKFYGFCFASGIELLVGGDTQ